MISEDAQCGCAFSADRSPVKHIHTDMPIYLLLVLFHCSNPSSPAAPSPWYLFSMQVRGWDAHAVAIQPKVGQTPKTPTESWSGETLSFLHPKVFGLTYTLALSAVFVKLMHINLWDQSSTSRVFQSFRSSVCPSVDLMLCEAVFWRARLHCTPSQQSVITFTGRDVGMLILFFLH